MTNWKFTIAVLAIALGLVAFMVIVPWIGLCASILKGTFFCPFS